MSKSLKSFQIEKVHSSILEYQMNVFEKTVDCLVKTELSYLASFSHKKHL